LTRSEPAASPKIGCFDSDDLNAKEQCCPTVDGQSCLPLTRLGAAPCLKA
jgi:hypothetical protein